MSPLTDRDRRQLDLVTRRLLAYREGRIELGRLINDLRALKNELGDLPKSWLVDYQGHWWTLEQIYAVARDRQYESLPDDHRVMVDEAVDALGFLVDEMLQADMPDELGARIDASAEVDTE